MDAASLEDGKIIETKATSPGNETNIRDWESAIFAGLEFGLRKYENRLKLERGHKLNEKPREIDVLIEDNEPGTKMVNPVAAQFTKYTVMEIKNPTGALNIDTVWREISRAAQFKSSGETVDSIPIDEVSITFLRVSRPTSLFKYMAKRKYGIERKYPGVYYITGMVDIKMQVVVAQELEGDEFVSLRVQKRNAKMSDIRMFLEFQKRLSRPKDKERAGQILQISISENKEKYAELLMEDEGMSIPALEELLKDRIDEKVERLANERAEVLANERVEALANERAEALANERAEALAEKRIEERVDERIDHIVANMIQNQFSFDKISLCTNVAIDRVREIANAMGMMSVVN